MFLVSTQTGMSVRIAMAKWSNLPRSMVKRAQGPNKVAIVDSGFTWSNAHTTHDIWKSSKVMRKMNVNIFREISVHMYNFFHNIC